MAIADGDTIEAADILAVQQAANDATAIAQAALPNTNAALAALMLQWLSTLPTVPQSTPGWWNNSGTPAFS